MAKCDNCGRETEIKECRIKDNMGVRYRNFCDDCIVTLSKDAQVDVLNVPETDVNSGKASANSQNRRSKNDDHTIIRRVSE